MIRSLLLAAGCSAFGAQAFAQKDVSVPISIERLSPRVLIVKSGEVYPDQVVAIAAERGLVVVDSGISPTLTTQYRRVIERELGRDDFAYLINTHHHFDHTNGNQVFADAVIIGHDNCPGAMREAAKQTDSFVRARRERLTRRAKLAKGLDPGSRMAGRLRDLVHMSRHMCDDLEHGFVLTPPHLTFSDRLTLDLGDLTFELVYFGKGLHTDNDIIVHVPEEGLVFTGDLLRAHGTTSTVTGEGELRRWVAALDGILESPSSLKGVVTIHAGLLPPERLTSTRDALVRLREEVEAKDSAGAEVERFLQRAGMEAALGRFRQLRKRETGDYYFLEGEFTALGYSLLGRGDTADAVDILRLNTEMFPESGDAHDSLGEALVSAGDPELVVACFERALEIDALDSYAFDMLSTLQADRGQR